MRLWQALKSIIFFFFCIFFYENNLKTEKSNTKQIDLLGLVFGMDRLRGFRYLFIKTDFI